MLLIKQWCIRENITLCSSSLDICCTSGLDDVLKLYGHANINHSNIQCCTESSDVYDNEITKGCCERTDKFHIPPRFSARRKRSQKYHISLDEYRMYELTMQVPRDVLLFNAFVLVEPHSDGRVKSGKLAAKRNFDPPHWYKAVRATSACMYELLYIQGSIALP